MTALLAPPPPDSLAAQIKKRQPFDHPSEEAHLNLMRTAAELSARSDALFKQHGLSGAKYNILRILRGAKLNGEAGDHGLPSLEVADRLITRVPDITRLVDGLIVDGLVTRTRCTVDRRVVYVGVTAAGLELLARLDAPLRELNRSSWAHMTENELAELNRLLVKARSAAC